jgi:hypothetical protein
MNHSKKHRPYVPMEAEEYIKEGITKMRKAKESMLLRWRQWQRAGSHPYQESAEYQQAVAFRQQFTPKDNIQYDWVCEYAQESYRWLHDIFSSLDEKADSVVKHLSSGTGLLALGAIALFSQSTTNAWIALMALPAFACALWSVRLAIAVRNPTRTTSPPPVEGVVKYAEAYGDNAQAMFLGQWHECCEGIALVVQDKAKKMKSCYRWYLMTLLCLLIPFIGGAVLKLTMPAPSGQIGTTLSPK